jgi:hypothetical protein
MSLISAGSISLDSAFKYDFLSKVVTNLCKTNRTVHETLMSLS